MTTARSVMWRGEWIGPARQDPGATEPDGVGRPAEREKFGRVLFRRSFRLNSAPAVAPTRISADSRYQLTVNGTVVGWGPQRSQPRRRHFDEWDIGPHLVDGTNVIAVLVTYFGESNAIWQASTPSGRLGAGPALLVEADIEGQPVVSDSTWRAVRSDAWSVFPRGRLDGVPAERFDARELPPDWTTTAFDDDHWPQTSPVAAAHRGATGRARPPVAPFGPLRPRTLPALAVERRIPRLVDAKVVKLGARVQNESPSEMARTAVAAPALGQVTCESNHVSSHVLDGGSLVVRVDFDRVVAGLIAFKLDSPEGTVVDVGFHERCVPAADSFAPSSGLRYIARGRFDSYRALESAGMRSATFVISPPEAATVTLRDIHLDEALQPWEGGAFFRSSDPELDALWRAGVRTVQLNTIDALTDCPTREQRAWVGDGVIHQAVHFVANSDWSATRAYVDLCASPRADGILPMSVAGDIEAADGVTIPSWSLHWVHGVYELFRHEGSVPEVLSALPKVRNVLAWFTSCQDDRGTLFDVHEWNLIDWSSVVTAGRSAALTALWVRALREYEEVSSHLGDTEGAGWARTIAESAMVGFDDFWDAERGLYVDSIVNGHQLDPVSQVTNAVAILSSLAPRERWEQIVERIGDPSRLVTRSWLGAPTGGLDLQKWERVAAGEWVIDWDARRQIVRAQPFFSSIVHDAFAVVGDIASLLRSLRDWGGFLHDGYDTFGEAWGWGTPCHGWSSTPTKDLTRHVLGVSAIGPGFARARVAPRPSGIELIEGAVPTGKGLLRLNVVEGTVELSSPVPLVFSPTEGVDLRLPLGQYRLDLRTGRHLDPPQPRTARLVGP